MFVELVIMSICVFLVEQKLPDQTLHQQMRRLFSGSQANIMVCPNCKALSERVEPFTGLPLPVRPASLPAFLFPLCCDTQLS